MLSRMPPRSAHRAAQRRARSTIGNGAVVIAAITSCTNTSNPSVMLAAGLLAKKAVERGLKVKPWVKTSLAPGSKVVTDYYRKSRPTALSGKAQFPPGGIRLHHLHRQQRPSARGGFRRRSEGEPGGSGGAQRQPQFRRPHQSAGEGQLPGLAAAGGGLRAGRHASISTWLTTRWAKDPPALRFICATSGPRAKKCSATVRESIDAGNVPAGIRATPSMATPTGRGCPVPTGNIYQWDEHSTYIKKPPYFDQMVDPESSVTDLKGMRALALLGDSVTTDHISPAGSIPKDSPAGRYLISEGVQPADFNSYGARRGNHEVMVRGTLANIRLRNQLAPGTEGGWTRHMPDGEQMYIYDASLLYQKEGVPLVILAGKEYGSGSSRDWAAKGVMLLGVRAVIAESFERIHRSNLVGMGVLPLQFAAGENAATLGLSGKETFPLRALKRRSTAADGKQPCARSPMMAPKRRLPYWFGSTPRRKWNITATAAFCRTCCGRSLHSNSGSAHARPSNRVRGAGSARSADRNDCFSFELISVRQVIGLLRLGLAPGSRDLPVSGRRMAPTPPPQNLPTAPAGPGKLSITLPFNRRLSYRYSGAPTTGISYIFFIRHKIEGN